MVRRRRPRARPEDRENGAEESAGGGGEGHLLRPRHGARACAWQRGRRWSRWRRRRGGGGLSSDDEGLSPLACGCRRRRLRTKGHASKPPSSSERGVSH